MSDHNPYAPPVAQAPKKTPNHATRIAFGIGVLLLFFSSLWALGGIALLPAMETTRHRHPATLGQENAFVEVFEVAFVGLAAAWTLSAGVGLIGSRRWAWLLALAYFGLALPLAALVIQGSGEAAVRLFFGFVFCGACIVLLLLLLPSVRKHFAAR